MSSPSLTMCLMTCGEETEKQCLTAIEPFRDKIEFFEVRNVYPQIKALNQMIDGVETEYFIPLDSDIILDPDAYNRIRNAINRHRLNPDWHSILFSLWDTLTEEKILALKILRADIAKEHMFRETATPDVEHYQRLTNKGYTCIDQYARQKPIGKHVVRGKKFCYHKYRDVYMTLRVNEWAWDEGAFKGGTDLRSRAAAHFNYFFYKWLFTEDEDYAYAIIGMLDGLMLPIENKSKSLEKTEYQFKPKDVYHHFLNWYLDGEPDSDEMLFA